MYHHEVVCVCVCVAYFVHSVERVFIRGGLEQEVLLGESGERGPRYWGRSARGLGARSDYIYIEGMGSLGERYSSTPGSGAEPRPPTIFEHVMIHFLFNMYSFRSFLYVANTHQYNTQ